MVMIMPSIFDLTLHAMFTSPAVDGVPSSEAGWQVGVISLHGWSVAFERVEQ